MMPTLEEEVAEKKAKLAQLQGQASAVPQAIPPEAIEMVMKVLTEQVKSVFAEVLTEEEKVFYREHAKAGALGITPFLKSQTIRALARMCSDSYRDFLKEEPK
jgi:hypothetical protein